ncbi:organic hydroperoxide resistance protein [Acetobacteraceae bacterium H6797]|nr:organic hydroperoxide resistance protein [Acetobacteraceae bacterium H6797]
MKTLYTANASATGGRDGQAATDEGNVSVKLAVPKEMGGPGGDATNPEQLFAMGYSACFLGALKFVAGKQKIKVDPASKVAAAVSIGPRDDGEGFGLAVTLTITLPGVSDEEADKLIKAADIVCPYSHSIRGNVEVTLKRG